MTKPQRISYEEMHRRLRPTKKEIAQQLRDWKELQKTMPATQEYMTEEIKEWNG